MQVIAIYFHTIRYLRPLQIYGQIRSRVYKPRVDLGQAPQLRVRTGTWTSPARREPSITAPNTVDLLKRCWELPSIGGWNDSCHEKLWLYHLHYFHDLNAQNSDRRTHWHLPFVRRWIEENPPGNGTGWEPYPLSVRIVNWIKWALELNALPHVAVQSLAVQARYLSDCLEYCQMGNHLLANAKGLVFAGMFFDGPEATGWLKKGLRILETELHEQILEDGGHFERSPMYHSIVLEDLLDLCNLARTYPNGFSSKWASLPRHWADIIQKMRLWLKVMCHPDGQIGLFNDAAFDGAPSPFQLESYAHRLALKPVPDATEGLTHLRSSGYVRLQRGPAVALLDIGEVGPDYIPGHAHADTLTFELSLLGARVIVNSGTSTYSSSMARQWQRSTAAHNTLEIDGQDSSEMWGVFRVARRARPIEVDISENDAGKLRVVCAHNGYRRLRHPVIHRRTWRLSADMLQVEDAVQGNFSKAVARFYFHPGVVPLEPVSGSYGSVRMNSHDHTLTCTTRGANWSVAQSAFYPAFGVSLPNFHLSATLNSNRAIYQFSWTATQ